MILVIGAGGQIGTELVPALRHRWGNDNVIATDVKPGAWEKLDVMKRDELAELVVQHKVRQIYLLAAMLSANGEAQPQLAWILNTASLLNVLEVARICGVERVFWPSSIAVFGPSSPRDHCPQDTVTQPATIYGVSKLAGEGWCQWYRNVYGLDVRSLRFPGLISYTAPPGGGTTDYAVDIFHKAAGGERFISFLHKDTRLPMMYMPDAIKAIMLLMEASGSGLRSGLAYNISAMDFTPAELTAAIQVFIPDFETTYHPDHRQLIADGWPQTMDDTNAREDWGWEPGFTMERMVKDIFKHLKMQLSV